jgi:hypothetical protein
MKYLLPLLFISTLLSCDKDDDEKPNPYPNPPTVTKVETSSELINGVARPKFTITLNVPNPDVTTQLEVYQNANFPSSKAGRILSPKSGEYVVIDSSAKYPPATTVKYFAFFTMKDYSFLSYYTFDVK